MPKLLNDGMSSDTHLSNASRHSRRCSQTKGAEELSRAINPLIDDLEEKSQATKQQKKERNHAYDDLIFASGGLNDSIRNVADAAKQYDRSHPGRPVFNVLFPEGGFSDILRKPIPKRVDAGNQIVERIKSLGEHSLASQIEEMNSNINTVRGKIQGLRQATTLVKTATAAEEIAQANLRKQYEFNSLDAIKIFGKSFANRLFPQPTTKKKIDEQLPGSDE